MAGIKNTALLGLCAAVMAAGGAVWQDAQAQAPMQKQARMEMQMPMPAPAGERERDVHIRVRFNIVVPLGEGGGNAAARAESRGRAAIYRMAEEECAVLESTIAATCRMSGIRIRSRARGRHNVPSAFLNVYGNARYMITLKGS